MGLQKRKSFILRIKGNVQNIIEKVYIKFILLC